MVHVWDADKSTCRYDVMRVKLNYYGSVFWYVSAAALCALV